MTIGRTQDPVRWGILGTGAIAHKFAADLSRIGGARLRAVGSRSIERAERFARRFGAERAYGDYRALAEDAAVDVAYVATPHATHREHSELCLEAGRPVLCEKPLAINAAECTSMISTARRRGLFLMEAMWSRFLPAVVELRSWARSERIGSLRFLTADMGFSVPYRRESRLFDPTLGGGALLDLGVYPLSLATTLFGAPEKVTSSVRLGASGVDEHATVLLEHSGDRTAVLSFSLAVDTPHEATLSGSEGQLRLNAPWWGAQSLTWSRLPESGGARSLSRRVRRLLGRGQEWAPSRRYHFPFSGNGYGFEALEVMRCLRDGRLESPSMPLDESLTILRVMDSLRSDWGVRLGSELAER